LHGGGAERRNWPPRSWSRWRPESLTWRRRQPPTSTAPPNWCGATPISARRSRRRGGRYSGTPGHTQGRDGRPQGLPDRRSQPLRRLRASARDPRLTSAHQDEPRASPARTRPRVVARPAAGRHVQSRGGTARAGVESGLSPASLDSRAGAWSAPALHTPHDSGAVRRLPHCQTVVDDAVPETAPKKPQTIHYDHANLLVSVPGESVGGRFPSFEAARSARRGGSANPPLLCGSRR